MYNVHFEHVIFTLLLWQAFYFWAIPTYSVLSYAMIRNSFSDTRENIQYSEFVDIISNVLEYAVVSSRGTPAPACTSLFLWVLEFQHTNCAELKTVGLSYRSGTVMIKWVG